MGYFRSGQGVIHVHFNNLRGKKTKPFLQDGRFWNSAYFSLKVWWKLRQSNLLDRTGFWEREFILCWRLCWCSQTEWGGESAALLGQLSLACHLSVSSALLDIYLPCRAAGPLSCHSFPAEARSAKASHFLHLHYHFSQPQNTTYVVNMYYFRYNTTWANSSSLKIQHLQYVGSSELQLSINHGTFPSKCRNVVHFLWRASLSVFFFLPFSSLVFNILC